MKHTIFLRQRSDKAEVNFIMKKKALISLLLSLLLVVFAGCGKSDEVTNSTGSAPAASEREEADEQESAKEKKGVSEKEEAEEPASEDTALRLVNTYFDQSKETENGGYTYFQSFGNHILCSLETETSYPKLAKTLRDLADDEEKFFKDEIKDTDREAFEYEESLRSSGNTGYYYHYADDVLKRADGKCVSIVRILNGYLGGAHPDYYYETFNIDTSNGKYILLSDVISDQDKLNEILKKKLIADYPDVEYFGLDDSLSEFDMSLLEGSDSDDGDHYYAYSFTLDPDGVSFYFSPYGISAYAYGDQVVKILYDEEPDLFAKDYSVNGGYISFLTDRDNKYGLGGTAEMLKVERTDYDDNSYFGQMDIYKGNKKVSVGDTAYYNQTAFTAHTENDEDFLYVMANMDNDYKKLFVINLTGASPSETEIEEDTRYCFNDYYDEASGIYGVVLPLYPEDCELAVKCDLLSTYNAGGKFEIQSSGDLKLKDKYLTIPENVFVLTSKADLTADIVDEDGSVKEKDVTIPKGSEYTLYRTDGESLVDAYLSDGRIVRMNVTNEYPCKVNDTYTDQKLFDGLMYAG